MTEVHKRNVVWAWGTVASNIVSTIVANNVWPATVTITVPNSNSVYLHRDRGHGWHGRDKRVGAGHNRVRATVGQL